MRFPTPPRDIEIAMVRARPNARATAYRFKSLKKFTVRKIDQTEKKVPAHAGLIINSRIHYYQNFPPNPEC
jgi:hypothetical protein